MMDFYYTPGSAPCHSVIMTAKAVGVELNKKVINIRNGENRTPEFLKLNPQHTIPTVVDDGFSLWESRAILVYLAEKYGKDDSLYPKCPKKRAVINQRLYFDMGTLYKSYADYFYPQIMSKAPADPAKLAKLDEALQYLNTFLEGNTFVAGGDSLTIADLAILATLASLVSLEFADIQKHSNVAKWYEKTKKIAPAFDEVWANCMSMKKIIQEMMK